MLVDTVDCVDEMLYYIFKRRKMDSQPQPPMQSQQPTSEPKQPAVATWLWVTLIIVIVGAFLVYWLYLR